MNITLFKIYLTFTLINNYMVPFGGHGTFVFGKVFVGGLFLDIYVGFECDASLQLLVVLMMMIRLGMV